MRFQNANHVECPHRISFAHVRAILRPEAGAVLDRARSALSLHERAPPRGAGAPAVRRATAAAASCCSSGEIGAGKTTVCRCFLEQIPKRCNVAYIFNPKLTVDELLKSVCDEFRIALGARPAPQPTVKDYVDALNEFLLQHARGRPEQRAHHRRGADALGRGARAAAPADQPRDQRAQAAADHPDRPARAARACWRGPSSSSWRSA